MILIYFSVLGVDKYFEMLIYDDNGRLNKCTPGSKIAYVSWYHVPDKRMNEEKKNVK